MENTQAKERIMKRIDQSVLLAGLLAMALAGCSSTGGEQMAGDSMATSQDGGSGATNSTSDSGTTASASDTYGAASGQESPVAAVKTPNSTVTSIEVVQRQPATGSSAVGSSGAGTTASAGERIYRITLRMDDGQSAVITQDWAPSFSTGDRVRMSSGAILR
jgi:hypothetical protein